MKLNHYQILGVSRNASKEDIKKAYRYLVFHFHPDRNVHSEGELVRINEAYRVLSNASSRYSYDLSLKEYDTESFDTPKDKWIKDTIYQSQKDVNDLKLNEAKGIRRDISVLMDYLNVVSQVDPLYNSNDPYTPIMRVLHK